MLNVTSYTTTNGEYLTTTLKNYDYDLFAIPSTTSGSYAAYYLADVAESYYLWNVRYVGAVIYTYYEYGVRPVVSLNIGTLTSGQVSGVWQLKS